MRTPLHHRSRFGPGFPGIGGGWRPTPGTLVLLVLTVVFTLAAVLGDLGGALVVSPRTLPELRLWTLFTQPFVNTGPSAFPLVLLLLIAAYFFQAEVRWLWHNKKMELLLAVGGLFVGAYVVNRVVPGTWGLLAALFILAWIGPVTEMRWGPRRFLLFCLWVALGSDAVGALLLWLAPGSESALIGGPGGLIYGNRPLIDGLFTAWAMMLGRARLAVLNVEAYKLVWLLVALQIIDLIFVSVLGGMMGLAAIAIARALIRGTWRPSRWFDRLQVWLLERQRRRRRNRLRVLKGGDDDPTLHRAAV